MRDAPTSGDRGQDGSGQVPVRAMAFDRWVADLPKYLAAPTVTSL
jgi:hypothetical protein